MRRLTALLCMIGLATGLLAPKMAAAAAELLPDTLRVVVICTGAAMQTIILDTEGEAVEIAETAPCVASDLPRSVGQIPVWHSLQLSWRPDTTAPHLVPVATVFNCRPPCRAPPKLV
ncbi:MAG: hypothetical protein AAGE03_08980 [Pseudomonadota bacterium]